MAQSIKNLLAYAREKLADSPSARFDAEILMAHVLESTRSFLYANPELELPANRSQGFQETGGTTCFGATRGLPDRIN